MHLSARWTLVSCLVTVTLHLGGRCLVAQPTPPVSQPSFDLSEPKKAYETFIAAAMRNDAATLKACVYFPNKVDEPLVDATITVGVSQHQLGQAAVAAFGPDAKSLVSGPGLFDDELKQTRDKLLNGIVEMKGDTATLRENKEYGTSMTFRLVAGQWKNDLSQYVGFMAKDRQQKQAEMLAAARVMDELTQQIKSGAFKDVQEAKAAWALKKIAATTAPATGPTTNSAPAERWLTKAAQPGLSPLQKAAYEQLAQVHLANLLQTGIPGSYELTMPAPGSTKAVSNLLSMGLDVVPILAEALDDTTLTKTVTMSGSRQKFEHRVNDIVARLIWTICGHTFVVGEEPNNLFLDMVSSKAELAPQFQKVISDWYKQNRNRTEVERKLADIDDGYFRNRFDAVEWFGRKKDATAVPAIIRNTERTLAAMEKRPDSLKRSELSECAVALGQIGDKAGLPAVQQACRAQSAMWDRQHRPTGSMDISDLFRVYHGMALLGEKDAALRELARIYDACTAEMEARSSREFKDSLDKAAQW